MKKIQIYLYMLVLAVISSTAIADGVTEVSRYTTVKNQATRAQVNPLLMTIQTHLPQSVQTVGDAMNYLLRYSGFSLIDEKKMDSSVVQMLQQPLPIVDREMGPMTLQDALETLAGKHVFKLTQDPLHRKLSFTLIPQMKKKYANFK